MMFGIMTVLVSGSAAHADWGPPIETRVTFRAMGPAGMAIEGTTSAVDVQEPGSDVVIDVPLSNLRTGIELRDRHMRDKYLEVARFPKASLRVPRNALTLPDAGKTVEATVPGSLTLHGQTKPVTVNYRIHAEGAKLAVHGTIHFDMRAFGIAVPTYLGVTVKPDVDVVTDFRLP
jgi:polyisoprenoid-binding protein YceI